MSLFGGLLTLTPMAAVNQPNVPTHRFVSKACGVGAIRRVAPNTVSKTRVAVNQLC